MVARAQHILQDPSAGRAHTCTRRGVDRPLTGDWPHFVPIPLRWSTRNWVFVSNPHRPTGQQGAGGDARRDRGGTRNHRASSPWCFEKHIFWPISATSTAQPVYTPANASRCHVPPVEAPQAEEKKTRAKGSRQRVRGKTGGPSEGRTAAQQTVPPKGSRSSTSGSA